MCDDVTRHLASCFRTRERFSSLASANHHSHDRRSSKHPQSPRRPRDSLSGSCVALRCKPSPRRSSGANDHFSLTVARAGLFIGSRVHAPTWTRISTKLPLRRVPTRHRFARDTDSTGQGDSPSPMDTDRPDCHPPKQSFGDMRDQAKLGHENANEGHSALPSGLRHCLADTQRCETVQ